MHRDYHKWWSPRLGRDMELLHYGNGWARGGVPLIVFPTSRGRFFEFEERGMVHAIAGKIDAGEVELFCVDSLDAESWYNRDVGPRWRIARHMQYESYLLEEVVPLVRTYNWSPYLASLGCSFGGYHAVNIALRRPDVFSGFFSLSGAFDISFFLHGYSDADTYFHLPTQYLPHLGDPWHLDRFRRGSYVLATGWDDQCLGQNQHMSHLLANKGVPHRLEIWDSWNAHDWPTWARQMQAFL
jgi:esterase/lipase superfamily enzyme